jgi:rod shape-determining protein MreD
MTRWRIWAAVAAVVVVQETVVPQVRILGVFPDLVAGFVPVAGLVGGAEEGAVAGFVAGMAQDLFLQAPFGMSATVYTVIGYLAGLLGRSLGASPSRLLGHTGAAVGSAAALTGYALVGSILGQPGMLTSRLPVTVGIVAAVNFLLATPLVKLARWATSPAVGDLRTAR